MTILFGCWGLIRGIREDRWAHCRSLHSATPDFLWNVVALVHDMRPSLRKGAYAVLSSDAWQEIRVRFGRDDKGKRGALRQGLLVAERNKGRLQMQAALDCWRLAAAAG
jgi:hypothetical protein